MRADFMEAEALYGGENAEEWARKDAGAAHYLEAVRVEALADDEAERLGYNPNSLLPCTWAVVARPSVGDDLAWGLRRAVPKDATAAWGARAIWRDGYVDIVWDRQGTAGDPEAVCRLLARLNNGALDSARRSALSLWRTGALGDGDFRGTEVLYEGEGVTIAADPLGSYGYLYIAAWTTEA